MDTRPQCSSENILIILLGRMGDALCALPMLRALRARYPSARIGWLIDEKLVGLIKDDPDLDFVYAEPHHRWRRMLRDPRQWPAVRREYRRFKSDLCSGDYAVSVSPMGALKTGFLARLAGTRRNLQRADDRLGRVQWLFPGERVPMPGPQVTECALALAAALDADISQPRNSYYVSEADRGFARELLDAHHFEGSGPVVGLNPGASLPYKTWPPERYAEAARVLRQDLDARIMVLGGPAEVKLAEQITRDGDGNALCVAGKTDYTQLAAVLERCDTIVSADTGPMHLAVALGKPVVALYGPTDPRRVGPYGQGHVVIEKHAPCSPCHTKPTCAGGEMATCPCMLDITVDEVVAAVAQVTGRA